MKRDSLRLINSFNLVLSQCKLSPYISFKFSYSTSPTQTQLYLNGTQSLQSFWRSLSVGLEIKNQVIYNIVACFLHEMHELGVTENIVNIALAKAGEAQANKVIQINLVIGELSGFVPDCIQFYFDSLSKNTIAQGAVLHFELVPTQLRCRNCSTIFHPQDTLWSCPKCGGQSVEIFKGRELYIESMEVE